MDVDAFLSEQDIYSAIGLPRNFTRQQLNDRYKELIRAFHPDKNQHQRANDAVAKLVNIKDRLNKELEITPTQKSTLKHPRKNMQSFVAFLVLLVLLFYCMAGPAVDLSNVDIALDELESVIKCDRSHDSGDEPFIMKNEKLFFLPRDWIKRRVIKTETFRRVIKMAERICEKKNQ